MRENNIRRYTEILAAKTYQLKIVFSAVCREKCANNVSDFCHDFTVLMVHPKKRDAFFLNANKKVPIIAKNKINIHLKFMILIKMLNKKNIYHFFFII